MNRIKAQAKYVLRSWIYVIIALTTSHLSGYTQLRIQKVHDTGKRLCSWMEYDHSRQNWVLADGMQVLVFDSSEMKLEPLCNTSPGKQHEIQLGLAGSILVQHFHPLLDFKQHPDSSAIYYFEGNSFKQVRHINPHSEFDVQSLGDTTTICLFGLNENRVMDENVSITISSTAVLLNSHFGDMEPRQLSFGESIEAVGVSPDGKAGLIALKGGEIKRIDLLSGEVFTHEGSDENLTASNFHFDTARAVVYAEVSDHFGNFNHFSVLSYSDSLHAIEEVQSYELGINTKINEAQFVFDFGNQMLYSCWGLSSLTSYDLAAKSLKQDFWHACNEANINTIEALAMHPVTKELFFVGSSGEWQGDQFAMEFGIFSLLPTDVVRHRAQVRSYESIPFNSLGVSSSHTYGDIVDLNNEGRALYNLENTWTIADVRSGRMDWTFISDGDFSFIPASDLLGGHVIRRPASTKLNDTLITRTVDLSTGETHSWKRVLLKRHSEELCDFSCGVNGNSVLIKWNDSKFKPHLCYAKFDYNNQITSIDSISPVLENGDGFHSIWKAWILKEDFLLYTLGGERMYLVNLHSGEHIEVLDFPSSTRFECHSNNVGFVLKSEDSDNEGVITILCFDYEGNLISKKKNDTDIIKLKENQLVGIVAEDWKLYEYDFVKHKRKKIELPADDLGNWCVDFDSKIVASETSAYLLQDDSLAVLYRKYRHTYRETATELLGAWGLIGSGIWSLRNGDRFADDYNHLHLFNDSLVLTKAYPYDFFKQPGYFEESGYEYKPGIAEAFVGADPGRYSSEEDFKMDYYEGLVALRNFRTGELVSIYPQAELRGPAKTCLSGDQRHLLIVQSPQWETDPLPLAKVHILDLKTGELSSTLLKARIEQIQFYEEGGKFLVSEVDLEKSQISLYTVSWSKADKIGTYQGPTAMGFQGVFGWRPEYSIIDDSRLAVVTDKGIEVVNIKEQTKEEIQFYYWPGYYTSVAAIFSDPFSNRLFVTYDDGGMVPLDLGLKQPLPALRFGQSSLRVSSVTKEIVVCSDEHGIHYFLNAENLELKYTLISIQDESFRDSEYIILLPDGQYLRSPEAGKAIQFLQDGRALSIREADLYLNRPDIVLQVLGADEHEIDFHKSLQAIRNASKQKDALMPDGGCDLGAWIDHLGGEFARICVEHPECEASDRLHILVNGCPEFGREGIIAQIGKSEHEIQLNEGDNIIYCWVESASGKRSRYVELHALGQGTRPGRWHFVGIGVSDYAEEGHNLRYADKDIRDLATMIAARIPNAQIDTLLNESVTLEAIEALKNRLLQTHPNDKVVMCLSGHGLKDSEGSCRFALHGADFQDCSGEVIAHEDIVDFLIDIPARYRIVTLDACHSGSTIEELESDSSYVLEEVTASSRQIKRVHIRSSQEKQESQLISGLQKYYTDQLSTSGINMVAASTGREVALEGDDWDNGVFTYCLINGWFYNRAMRHEDLDVQGLFQYMTEKVKEYSGGIQTPNIVMQNSDLEFELER